MGDKLFWKEQEDNLVSFECFWRRNHMLSIDCSNEGVLDGQLESSLGNRLLLVGPTLKVFIFACYKFSRVLNFASFLVNFREIKYHLNFSKFQNREIKYQQKKF